MLYWQWFTRLLGEQKMIWVLFFINLLGTIYGYIWYVPQLGTIEWWLLPFVPDSPTASLFFTITLFVFLLREKWRLMEALAVVTLFKYRIRVSVMILWANLQFLFR